MTNAIRIPRMLPLLVAVAAIAGCITVNVYFPAPEVREAAERIVDETWGGAAAGQPATPDVVDPGGSSSLLPPLVAPAYAQALDINVSTAAIRTLKEQMKARSEQLKPFLRAGQVGIAKDGKLVVRSVDGVSLKDQAAIRRLVEAENRDRDALYREITKANNFGEERLGEVQRIFAETWIEKAETGWWVEQSGWKKK